MEYQKIINLLDNTPNQPSKFRTKNWVEINDDYFGTYNSSRQIKFKTMMFKTNLCDYSDTYILVKRTITVTLVPPSAANPNNNKEVVFKNCGPFTDCLSQISNT